MNQTADKGILYEACFRNLTFGQAQAMYRVAMDLEDHEPLIGSEGSSWSGLLPGGTRDIRKRRGTRTLTIQPMKGELDREQSHSRT